MIIQAVILFRILEGKRPLTEQVILPQADVLFWPGLPPAVLQIFPLLVIQGKDTRMG